MFEFLKKRFQPAREQVICDDEKVVRTRTNGETESIRWDKLESVEIMTTDEGPFGTDLFWLLRSSEGGCAVPSDADGCEEMLARLQELPGFDNCGVVAAMGSTDNHCFQVWCRRA